MLSDSASSRIGIVGSFNPGSGGEYQYSLSVLRALDRLGERDYVVFARPHEQEPLDLLHLSSRFVVAPLDPPGRARLWGELKSLARRMPAAGHLQAWRRAAALPPSGALSHPAAAAHFRKLGARWMFYTAPNALSFESGLPFIMPIHDMQHRLQPDFPEVSIDGEYERREYLFGSAARHARMILVDSEIGKEDVLNAYGSLGITEDRIGILPYLPPDYLRQSISADEWQAVRKRYALPNRYLFYPAQFWPHKNHRRLVEAVGMLAAAHDDMHLVLVGSASGRLRAAAYSSMRQAAERMGVTARIHNLGYVPNADMAALYAGAVALVFPTFFGPTNIPVLEAWALGIPVITSRIRGVTEQVGDAGLLADPTAPQDIAAAIARVWTDATLRATLAARGRARLSLYDAPQFDARLADILACTDSR
jgi:glycosyltransferase involved in cell wall biosynthesis